MKTNQFNQVIEAAEGIVIKGKSQKQEISTIAEKLTAFFNENNVSMNQSQSEAFANEYLEKRKIGLK